MCQVRKEIRLRIDATENARKEEREFGLTRRKHTVVTARVSSRKREIPRRIDVRNRTFRVILEEVERRPKNPRQDHPTEKNRKRPRIITCGGMIREAIPITISFLRICIFIL